MWVWDFDPWIILALVIGGLAVIAIFLVSDRGKK